MSRTKKIILAFVVLLLLSASVLYIMASWWNKKAIERRTKSFGALKDRYDSLPEDRKKVVDELMKSKDNPEEIKRISYEIVKISNRDHGIPESDATIHSALGMCAGFAEAVAQYLGNDIPSYSGDAWTMYKRNPRYRRYQLYTDSIDLYRYFRKGSEGPRLPDTSNETPPLRTGDVVTMPWPGTREYVYHAGTVIVDTKSTPPRKFVLETRGSIRMNEIVAGNILLKTTGSNTKTLPIAEVIGDSD